MMYLKALVLVEIVAVLALGQDINFGGVTSKLFTAKCSPEQYTGWTDCLWPQGDLKRVITAFVSSARQKSCKVPPNSMLKTVFDVLKQGDYLSHPLYSLIPSQPCGFCGRKVKCCPTSRSFLMQSYKSDFCDQTATPYCTMPQITDERLAAFAPKYSQVTFNGDRCDFNQFSGRDFGRVQTSPGYQMIKPLICQLYGSTQPRINCVRVDNECRCCCLNYVYRDGNCVPEENGGTSDNSCD